MREEDSKLLNYHKPLTITEKNRLARLEEENAELKDALKDKKCNCMTYLNFKDLEKELTKAKEIIKKYMLFCKGELTHYKDIEEQAEQFLKEIEK